MLKFIVIFILFNVHDNSTDTQQVYKISSYIQNMRISFISKCALCHNIILFAQGFGLPQNMISTSCTLENIKVHVFEVNGLYAYMYNLSHNQRMVAIYQVQQLTIKLPAMNNLHSIESHYRIQSIIITLYY